MLRPLTLALLATACTTTSADAPDDSGDTAASVVDTGPRRFDLLALDNGKNQLLRIDAIGDDSWIIPVNVGPRDLTRLDDDRVLVSEGTGFAIVAIAHGTVLERVDSLLGVQTAQPLPDGSFLAAAQVGKDVVLHHVVDGASTETRTYTGYEELRLLRVVEGTGFDDAVVRFTTSGPYRIVEVGPDGTERRSLPLGGKGYQVESADGGGLWATTGEDACLVHMDDQGTVDDRWACESEHPDLGLDWSSGFDVTDAGEKVVTNWLGHNKWGTGPHVVVYDDDNEVVWSWEDHDAALQVTNVLVVGAAGM